MASPRLLLSLVAVLLTTLVHGGPLGPLPNVNVTSADMGLKEGTCALGDVVYLPGDEFPGSSPCERCTCTAGGVQCAHQQCTPRPGCKALHRPDQCCPTYQCECEQDGHVYGNGEKLVDPKDPCRVCYCQGGEVVCRRIACFQRDDCTPRLVPGRCCPEYDNCPLRGVTSLPGTTSSAPSVVINDQAEPSLMPSPQKEVKQEITIKEITPVSEIPVITDVKIKEILPSPSEAAEYSSSKSPLIPREATSEKTTSSELTKDPENPSFVEIHPSETIATEIIKTTEDSKIIDDAPPSKISLSTQDSINSDIYPSNVPVMATMGIPLAVSETPKPAFTTIKAPVIEDEDPSLFDHNPAFPPLPDDLSVLSNHGDEIVPEPSADTDHISVDHSHAPDSVLVAVTASTESKELLTTTAKFLLDSSIVTTEKTADISTESSTTNVEIVSARRPISKENPMINVRSAIPTEIISASSEDITTTTDNQINILTTTPVEINASSNSASETPKQSYEISSKPSEASRTMEEFSTEEIDVPKKAAEISIEDTKISKQTTEGTTEEPSVTKKDEDISTTTTLDISTVRASFTTTSMPDVTTTSQKATESALTDPSQPSTPQEQTTSSIAKSNEATEVTLQTELSSLPIETSDQNPHDASENISKDVLDVSTLAPLMTDDQVPLSKSEVITVSRSNDNGAIDNVETTEFIISSFGSSESATDAVELIKVAVDTDKSAAFIDTSDKNKNALTDLIKLVSDVASISDHEPSTTPNSIITTIISDSEELIPVNAAAGYKSKNSNFNQNSITEIPTKSKVTTQQNKQKIIEIDDDETDNITDSPPPNDKVEPTTRRPIIDNVSDDKPEMKSDKKDIEIITQSYVPTINKRPTKVVLKEETQGIAQDAQKISPAETTTVLVTALTEQSTEHSTEKSGEQSEQQSTMARSAEESTTLASQ